MSFVSGDRLRVFMWTRCVAGVSLIVMTTSCSTTRPERAAERIDDVQGEAEVEEDPVKVHVPHEKAGDGDDWSACTRLGMSYQEASGAPEGYERANALFAQACEGGHAQACTKLGYNVEMGLGAPTDISQAIVLYRKACEADDAAGCFNLGRRYQEGLVVPRDLARARTLFVKACEGGSEAGCFNLVGAGTQGKISKLDVYKQMNRRLGDIQTCYEREAVKKPGLKGDLMVGWIIEPDGLVSNVHVISYTLQSTPTHKCVMGIIAAMEFVEPVGGRVTFVYPFRFRRR